MCGLAGYINLSKNSIPLNSELLHKLHTCLVHRGPDGYGVWKSEKHEIALVHRRLSIIDLSDAGAQPMMDAQQSVVISFNGEIYNYLELRKELQGLGYSFSSNSDTEVILYAYKAWGIACLDRFDGMFAFALFDLDKNELYLVRDRIGIKPLYVSMQNGVLSFASEIKALWQLPWIERHIKPDALYHYLTYLATPAPMTLYEGVYKLPAGFYAKLDAHKTVSFHQWYDLATRIAPIHKEHISEEEHIHMLRSLLRASVKKRMLSDVPVGAFLSGGIDSSLNVALMAEIHDNLKTFNISFADGPELQERDWARKVAKKFNTDHHELIISEKEAFDFFQSMIYHQDEPLADVISIPLYYVSKLAKDNGVTVVQVGEGSDELFCGYKLYTQYLQLNKWWSPTQKYMPMAMRKGLFYGAKHMYPLSPYKMGLLHAWANGRSLFLAGALGLTEAGKMDLFKNNTLAFDPVIQAIYKDFPQAFDSYAVADYHRNQLLKKDAQADFLKSIGYIELKHRLPELLLMRIDKMAMATAIEARVPFLDYKLVEYALQIPAELKYKNNQTKYILKKVCEGILPDDIIYRKKVGFAAPVIRWFKQGSYFKTSMYDMLQSKNELSDYLDFNHISTMMQQNELGKKNFTYQLWALNNVLATAQK